VQDFRKRTDERKLRIDAKHTNEGILILGQNAWKPHRTWLTAEKCWKNDLHQWMIMMMMTTTMK